MADILGNIPAADAAEIYYLVWGKKPAFSTPQLTYKGQNVTSKLGAPYWHKDSSGREYFMPVKIGNVDLPVPFISLESSTIIVDTPMVSAQGAVIELIAQENRRMRVRGICLGVNGVWPEDQVAQLIALDNNKQSYEIENVLAAIAGISHIVIRNFRIMETAGKMGIAAYEMELIDDKPFELVIS